jgi:hypothetical protein
MAAALSKGGGVKVDGISVIMTQSMRKRTAAARFEVGVEVAAYAGAKDEVAVCSGSRIEHGKWRQWHDGF